MILGSGSALGKTFLPASEIAAKAGVTPEWITARTGIRGIHVRTEPLSRLASSAAELALSAAGHPKIETVVLATCSADYVLPSMASQVCRDLGINGVMAFDVQANCTGFVDAFYAASCMDKRTLLIGAEALSDRADPTNIESILFVSDGAGAVVLEPGETYGSFYSDGSNFESVRCTRDGKLEMQGLATWKQTVTNMPRVCREAVDAADWRRPDLVIFHQANLRMMEFLMNRLGWPMETMFSNVEHVGNTGAASIPIALTDAMAQDRLHGHILLAGVGAGFTFGAVTLEQP